MCQANKMQANACFKQIVIWLLKFIIPTIILAVVKQFPDIS